MILLLFSDFFAACSSNITLKNTHNDSESFLTSPCPRSMYNFIKVEIVCTAFAPTSSELVSHQSNSNRMKTAPIRSSATLWWYSRRHRAYIARIRISPSESSANSISFLIYRSCVKVFSRCSWGMVNLQRSNFTIKSVVAFKDTNKWIFLRSSAEVMMCVQYKLRNFSTRGASSRQKRASRMRPYSWHSFWRSYFMIGMKSSMLTPALNLLRIKTRDLVLSASASSCS